MKDKQDPREDGQGAGLAAFLGKTVFTIPVGNQGRGTPVNVIATIAIVIVAVGIIAGLVDK